MASTLQIITEVSNRTMSKLTIRPSEWTSFLSTAARNYKYSFAEQVLIYAQRPYATACAPIELWNERFGRRVKRGSHGIALIDDSSAKLRLRYVFDVSDTVKSVGRPVPIWQMDEKYVEPVIEALEAGFGDLAHKNDIAEAILSASDNAVEDNMTDYLTELFTVREDSFLEELDDFNVEVALKRAIRASVAYMVLTRCGVDASKYFEVDDFIPILDFNTILAISLLGSAVSDISEMVLGEIGDTIRYQRVVENHKLAKSKNIVQNVNVSRKNNVERGDEHGDDIHNAGRLPFARPDTAGAAVHREIWDAAQIIPQKPSAGDVHQPASLREADGSPRGDRQDGTGARRADDGADGLDGERERGDESLRPDEMDGADEQPEALGGGNDSDGTDLQLTDEQSDEPEGDKPSGLLSGSVVLPSVAEQISIIEQAEAQTSVFSVSQQIIDAVLSSGGNAKNSTLRIFAKYTRDKSAEDNITFLRREYKRGGKGFIIDGKKVSALWSPEEGMRIAFGETTFLAGEMVPLGWDQIERRIRELIELSRYIPQSDVLAVPEYERQELASRIWDTCRDDLSGIPKEWRSEKGGFPEDVKKIATLLSDPVVLADIISHLETEIAAYDAQKRRGYHDVHQLLNDVRDMRRDPRTFTAQEAIAEECEYFITQDEIDAELCRGGQTQDGKYRIYHFFKGNSDSKDRVDFLKHEYGTGGRADGVYNIWNDAKGLSIRKHIVTDPDGKMLLTWPKVARRIGELIAADRYLTGKEKERLPTVEAELVERARLSAERKAARAILERAPEPNRENAEYALSLGAEVHIGADPYEILSIDPDRVVLFDPAFPLFNKEMTREEFDRKVRENPLNDHLIVKEPAIAPQRSSDDVFDEYSALFVSKVLFDEAYMNARSNADEQNAKTECDDAMQRVFHAFDPLEHTALYKAFTESPSFAQRMKDHVFQKTYIEFADMIEPGEVSDSSPVGRLHDVTSTPDGDAEYADQDMALQDEPEPQDLKPTWEKHTDNIIRVRIDLMPETPAVDRINFRITDDNLGHGGPKAKYGLNVAAIRALQLIEADNRLATAEEQEVLSRYVGWGGVADVFDENKPEWAKEYAELKELLSDDEYRSARESVLNAHYTSPVVIKAIYSALENMGFRTGNILEPGCGVGNFFGLVPESMENSRLYGVELDSITGRIARQLYQRASIRVQGYEAANLPDSFFDVAIGNVPFGQYSVPDKRYDKLKLSIHDYFFAKTLDKVRPGGVVAFITSSFTMDKKTSAVRKYIAERAELLGAVRLPNNAFLRNAGTSVVTDILFLQKRDRPIETEPSWVHLGKTADGFAINQYFIDNPHMVLGRLAEEHTQYGHMALTCMPIPGAELSEQLRDAMANINAEIAEYGVEDLAEKEEGSIPADPSVRNFSFAVVDGKLYYRENSKMNPIETSITGENRIKGMVEIRECVRQLIEYQTEDYSDDDIRQEQARLNRLYDSFTSRYGLLNIRANSAVFSDDSAYPLLCSLEVLDDEGNLKRKADMFSKRTIRRRAGVTHVDTAAEALAVSIGERARVDLGFMSSLMGKPGDIEGIADGLHGVIYKDPDAGDDLLAGWQTADEYLSGNVRKKLAIAKKAIELNPIYAANVEALEAVQPVDLTAAEISVRLGATWLPPDVVEQFVHELLSPPFYLRRSIKVHYMPYNSEWNIEGKNQDHGNVKAKATYGTERANAYKIIEETLNLRDIRVFDAVYDDSGNRTYVLNKKETAIARQKQSLIKQEFNDWIWKDPDRRERLCRLYNDKFNSVRPREYDGRHIQFIGMNPEMALRTHQINAVARVLYGGNTLLAHVVGAGKSATRS